MYSISGEVEVKATVMDNTGDTLEAVSSAVQTALWLNL
jgi:hypothetical protein